MVTLLRAIAAFDGPEPSRALEEALGDRSFMVRAEAALLRARRAELPGDHQEQPQHQDDEESS
jgi:hypothetical protein